MPLSAQTPADARLYHKSEMPLVWHLRKLDPDAFRVLHRQELDYLDYLESTKRHKARITAQRRKVEIFTSLSSEF